ncbi:uncharacterized protein LOC117595912 isoform X2 [Pangasianodon hypophthalmus]|uniref:uncharacterized protein LOC117595912 isoform X2 n=1 Tax=Pangasianodon hypophthalmus TaxID=310915 RepID=UPI002306FC34|nr:uncharacterized protein LOC117595912 isoform X2 [Pangasianodon hypophthalmus]
MRSYKIHVFLFRCLILVTGHFVKTRCNESATLPCKRKCSGLVKWVKTHSRDDVIAQCDQTSCSSEEGYEMSHAQYLKGDLSLTITAADYSKRSWYTCQCEGKDVCDVRLSMERVNFIREFDPGDSLTVDLPISERVKITFNRSGDDGTQSSVTLCTVEGRKVHCSPEYEKRTSFQSSLTLSDLKLSDGGVYTVWDTENDEIIATHTLSVTGKIRTKCVEGEQVPSWVVGLCWFCLGLVLGIFLHCFVLPSILNCCDRDKKKRAKNSERDCSTAEKNDDSTEIIQLNTVRVESL